MTYKIINTYYAYNIVVTRPNNVYSRMRLILTPHPL